MPKARIAAYLALAAGGVSLAWLGETRLVGSPWPAVGAVGLTFVAAIAAVHAHVGRNVPIARVVALLLILAHALLVQRVTGSLLLGLAVAVPLCSLLATTLMFRLVGYRHDRYFVAGALLGVTLVAASWPYGLATLAVVPSLLVSLFLSRMARASVRDEVRARPARWSVRVGEGVPSFELPPRGGGEPFSLASARGRFVVLSLVRGDWCPVCMIHMRVLRNEAAQLTERQALLVVISESMGDEAARTAKEIGVDYVLLEDAQHEVARMFGAVVQDATRGEVVLPSTFVIDPLGTLRYAVTPNESPGVISVVRLLDDVRASAPVLSS